MKRRGKMRWEERRGEETRKKRSDENRTEQKERAVNGDRIL